MLEHGGRLRDAARRYGRPLAQWLDLSTGINPVPWPVPALPPAIWHRLPEPDSLLTEAACAYYRAPRMLAVAGTQAAIQALPRLRQPSRILVAAPAYAEHAHSWRVAGHQVREMDHACLDQGIADADVLVLCNPNNPTGATVDPDVLLDWHGRLAARGGWLVVDEAFGDTVPALSVAHAADREGLVVLRSVGKFFGLAGLRLGFVAADEALLARLAASLGPWTISTAAQQIGRLALADVAWQQMNQTRLQACGQRLQRMLDAAGIVASGTALFQWWPARQPEALHAHMAARGILVRCFAQDARGIRLGLPADESGWTRLQQALAAWQEEGQA
ncbi:MAG TPA: threonine-phosphate decarboxylase CobD [Noviherbaspirillum sp.]|jgi:cobalamin biosynthetic protein CobC|uniref:threonine-phosphate decarboxylase CobD n=1 Tax=Noviherbaspirillum sp. TaxID=1926288 RepID=UPI002F95AAD9